MQPRSSSVSHAAGGGGGGGAGEPSAVQDMKLESTFVHEVAVHDSSAWCSAEQSLWREHSSASRPAHGVPNTGPDGAVPQQPAKTAVSAQVPSAATLRQP